MKPPTSFLARLLGLFMLIVGVAMLMQKSIMIGTAVALVLNQPLLLLFAMLTLLAGLAIVLSHNVWSGGALPVVVTLCGWIMLLKGIGLLFISPEQAANLMAQLHYKEFYMLYAALPAVLGLYLTWGGFRCTKMRNK